jgi:hypothetical protein
MDTSTQAEAGFPDVLSGEVAIGAPLSKCSEEHTLRTLKGTARMTKTAPTPDHEIADSEAICSTTTIAALLLLGAQFPHRQFNSAELCVLSGTPYRVNLYHSFPRGPKKEDFAFGLGV